MKFFGDYHMHTQYSDGRASVEDMVFSAVQKGLKEVGIADHGPRNIGTGVKNNETFLDIKEETRALREKYDVDVYVGAEADIISLDGEIDISKEIINELDYLLVGLHPYILPKDFQSAVHFVMGNQAVKILPNLKERVRNVNTKALVDGLNKYNVYAITHPNLGMEIDIQEVAKACVKNNTAWEINTGHLCPTLEDLLKASKIGIDFVVNSDAHYPETVGELDYGEYVLTKLQVPQERVRNLLVEGKKESIF